jgi:hypothetical protein
MGLPLLALDEELVRPRAVAPRNVQTQGRAARATSRRLMVVSLRDGRRRLGKQAGIWRDD